MKVKSLTHVNNVTQVLQQKVSFFVAALKSKSPKNPRDHHLMWHENRRTGRGPGAASCCAPTNPEPSFCCNVRCTMIVHYSNVQYSPTNPNPWICCNVHCTMCPHPPTLSPHFAAHCTIFSQPQPWLCCNVHCTLHPIFCCTLCCCPPFALTKSVLEHYIL